MAQTKIMLWLPSNSMSKIKNSFQKALPFFFQKQLWIIYIYIDFSAPPKTKSIETKNLTMIILRSKNAFFFFFYISQFFYSFFPPLFPPLESEGKKHF